MSLQEDGILELVTRESSPKDLNQTNFLEGDKRIGNLESMKLAEILRSNKGNDYGPGVHDLLQKVKSGELLTTESSTKAMHMNTGMS